MYYDDAIIIIQCYAIMVFYGAMMSHGFSHEITHTYCKI